MCGIAGFLYHDKTEPHLLNNMLDTLQHRGPDARGQYIDGAYHAGMTRLAINGLTDGNQPIFDESENVVLLYNGEIYNAPQLTQDLKQKGYRFKTHSDGEVIAHLYHEFGEDLFSYLDGMFAVALWIKSEQKLILARDLAGEKPLYYAPLNDGQCVFASEIKAIRQFSELCLSLNKQAIWDFPTFLWIPEPSTIYKEVFALPKGHTLVAQNNEIRIQSYSNRFGCDIARTPSQRIEQIHDIVTQAVQARLLSDVPIGCFLSSGLDSSIVTTIAVKHHPLHTFCVAFEDLSDPYHGRSNESDDAKAYAKILGTNHITVPVTAKDFTNLLDNFCHYGDQPFAVSSGLGILSVAKAAREHNIKVLLSGDGADECFGGYSWYAYLNQAPQSIRMLDEPFSFQNFGQSIDERLHKLAHLPGPERAYAWHYYAHEAEKAKLFNLDWVDSPSTSSRHFYAHNPHDNWQAKDFIEQDRQFYFPNEMLTKLDRMCMAYSVESRAPFAAPSIHALAQQLSFEDMVQKDELKTSLRQAFAKHLPQRVLKRKKHGFNVPVDHWLKKEWHPLLAHTFSKDSALAKLGIIPKSSYTYAQDLLNDKIRLNGHTLFCFIMLDKWLCNEQN